MSLTRFELPSLKEKLEEKTALVVEPKPKAVKVKKVGKLGKQKKGKK